MEPLGMAHSFGNRPTPLTPPHDVPSDVVSVGGGGGSVPAIYIDPNYTPVVATVPEEGCFVEITLTANGQPVRRSRYRPVRQLPSSPHPASERAFTRTPSNPLAPTLIGPRTSLTSRSVRHWHRVDKYPRPHRGLNFRNRNLLW